ncbi:MAG: FAD-dependent oxidoreductase [Chloroflexota bacterium]
MIKTDILIVGAGISGLLAAEKCKQANFNVQIVDKGRGVGGRMATRRIGPGRADHGAQFFTVRSPIFQAFVDDWLAQNLVFQWAKGWSDDPAIPAKEDGYPRYAGVNGMTAVSKALAPKFDVQVSCKLTKIEQNGNLWLALAENGEAFEASKLLLTPPVPQSLALLDAGCVPLKAQDRTALEQIAYAPCVAGMFWIEGQVNLPEPGALQRPNHTFSWIANNQRKGISPDAQLITVHANEAKSWEIWDASQDEKVAELWDGLRPLLDPNATLKEAQAHRWRYAQPTVLYPERTLIAQNLPPLAFAGDAFKEARVEGAALSGLAAADALINHK